MTRLLVGLLCLLRLVPAPVTNLVVLYVENHSFDHYFGCATAELPGIDGLTGNEKQWIDPNDHSKGSVSIRCGASEYVCQHGPGSSAGRFYEWHKTAIFGAGVPVPDKGPYPNATMEGFANVTRGDNVVFDMFSPAQLPIKMALAKEFGLFDRFFSSVPAPSQPNHMFAQSATSCGATDTGVQYRQCGGTLPLFPQRTIFDSILEAGKNFALYYDDIPGDIYMTSLLEKTPTHAHTYDAKDKGWYDAAKAGTLPELSWIVPRYQTSPNDDHPCHDVALGEALLKQVYETLRASPQWNSSALFVIYDDSGGYYDHVPPPTKAPPPESSCDVGPGCPDAFAFDRLGVRLANLLISPLLPKGTVIKDPAGPPGTPTRPFNDSVYEMSSISATIKNLFGLPKFLTKRDAWAGSFHDVFTLTEPRDTPRVLPDPPPPHSPSSLSDDEDDGDDDGDDDWAKQLGAIAVGRAQHVARRMKATQPHFAGSEDPSVLTRRQRRWLRWYGTLLGEEEEAIQTKSNSLSMAEGERWLADAVQTTMERVKDGSLNHLFRRDEL